MKQLQEAGRQYDLLPYKGETKGRIIAHLGFNEKGKPFYLDFCGKTHLLIAGITGSGKTTLLHNIICSLIQAYSIDLIQFILVTGEKSGFTNYKNIPCVLQIAVLQDERILKCLENACAELERRKQSIQSGENNDYKPLFIVVDGLCRLSVFTKVKAIQYLNRIVDDGYTVSIHLIFSMEESLLLLQHMISIIPNRIVFATSQTMSKKLLGSEIAAEIIMTGEAYAKFADSPCIHFYTAKSNVHAIVKPFNDQADLMLQQEINVYQARNAQKYAFDQLDPYQFEQFVAQRMRDCGYTKVQVTQKSGDYGADVLGVDKQGRMVCVQCKKYTGKVGFDAVQQINTARTLFHCERALLVTNSTLTQQAKETARKLQVEVYERFNPGSVIN